MCWESVWEDVVYGGFIAIIFAMIFRLAQMFGMEHLWAGIPFISD